MDIWKNYERLTFFFSSFSEDEVEKDDEDVPMEAETPAFIDTSFSSLEEKVSDLTLKGIADMGFTHMTEIQHKSIPHLLEGR